MCALMSRRGGGSSAQHVDILGNTRLINDVLLILTGSAEKVPARVDSDIDALISSIDWAAVATRDRQPVNAPMCPAAMPEAQP
jgi:hypothetical protein